jgi:glycosyltransferase involved in cell wall biosynthesis
LQAKDKFQDRIKHWGFLPDKTSYWGALAEADVAVSTANHEFFGVSMVESAIAGCSILAPNRLAYPEIFPKKCLYSTEQQLFKRLRAMCINPSLAKDKGVEMSDTLARLDKILLKEQYKSLFK